MPAEKEPEPINDYEDVAALVAELEDLVKFALDAEHHMQDLDVSAFVEVHKKLMKIQSSVAEFRRFYKESLSKVGLNPEDLRPTEEDLKKLGVKERRAIEKLASLQGICEQAKERMYEALQEDKKGLDEVKKELKESDQPPKKRKSRLKGVGGKKGWLPS